MRMNTPVNMPPFISKYIVMTLNKRGPVSSYIDEYTQQFIDFAGRQTELVLELGAAYGFISIEAIKQGATVIANDIELQHLRILYHNTPKALRDRLRLLPGAFPQAINLPEDSLGACYVSRMLGYLNPSELQEGFEKIYNCLQQGGRLYILATTPYKALFKDMIPIYEQRIHENNKWPGYFTHLKQFIPEKYHPYIHQNNLHLFDDKILSRELKRVGFIVEKAELYARKDLPRKALLDGREGVVAIARKPQAP